VLLDHNHLLVKSQSKKLSSSKTFEIADAASGETLGSAKDTADFLASLFGSVNLEVRDVSNNAVVFVVRRSGWLFKKDQVLDARDEVVGRYKAKLFSLSGGFHVYDKDAKHIAEIRGKMFKAEYKFITPDKTTEMGSVSRTWSGLAKSLATGDDTYVVQIAPKYENDERAKMLMLGAALAVESIFKKKKESKGGGSSEGGGGGDDE
jgi:uncharacterized protein YxjI